MEGNNRAINPQIFEAYLKCDPKCYLNAVEETGSGNAYASVVNDGGYMVDFELVT